MKDIVPAIIGITVCVLFVIYGVYIMLDDKFHLSKKILRSMFPDMKYTVKCNGVDVVLSSKEYDRYLEKKHEELAEKEKQEKQERLKAELDFKKKCTDLDQSITSSINNCTYDEVRHVLQNILNMNVTSEQDYEYKLWLFNDGKLRTNEEVSLRNEEMNKAKKLDTFDTDRHITTFVSSFIGFFLTFGLTAIALPSDFEGLRFVIGIWLGLLGGLIGSAIGHTINIANAEEYGIPASDKRVISERISRGVDIAGVAIGTVSVAKKTKAAIKDIGNPEGWKEME